jgi:hypothetical protein
MFIARTIHKKSSSVGAEYAAPSGATSSTLDGFYKYLSPRDSESHLQTANQQLPLIDHLWRQAVMQIEEQLFMAQHFLTPR